MKNNMNHFNLFKLNKSSRTNSRNSMQQLMQRVVAILVLACVCVGAWATDYVFVYNGNYLGIDASGQITNYTTFNPTYCVWTCYNGTNEASLQNSNTLYSLENGNYYLNGSTTNGNAPTTSNSAKNYWRWDGNYLIYRNSNSYYLYYRNGGWKTSRSSNGSQESRYSYGTTDYRATVTVSSNTGAQDNTTLPTVSCGGLSGTTGIQMSHTNLGGTYTPAATTLTVGGTTYYKGSDGKYSTTAPSATLNPTYTWSINSGNASITSNGVLTLNNDNAQTVTVRLTVTNTDPKLTKTVDYTLTTARTNALNETAYSDITVTPASQTLDLGGTATYTIPQSISQLTRTRPLFVTITSADDDTFYKVGTTYQDSEPTVTETPGTSINLTGVNWAFSGGDGNYYTTPAYYSTGNTLTLTRTSVLTASNKTFDITASAKYGSIDKEGTATVTIPLTYTDLTALHAGDAINIGINESASIEGHYTWEPDYDAAGAAYKEFTYTSGNTDVATVDANGKVTGVGPGTTTITIQSKKMDSTNGVSCDVTVNVSVAAPIISIDADGKVTITPPIAGMQIQYTTDGSNPTATMGTVYSATFGPVSNETTVKAVTVYNSMASSVVSKQYITSGITSDGKVILHDYEDHTWTYYAGVNDSVDGGHYNTAYLGKLYSPDPRNVKITYNATSGAQVSISESQTSFVYYKTIEKVDNAYKYQVISNPFSKRPAHSGSTYYGFTGWKIVSGGQYIDGYNDGQTIPIDAEITFVNLTNKDGGEYTPNCTSAEIVFETTWGTANRTYISTNPGSAQTYTFNSGTYETNFVVINVNYTRQITISGSATIMMVEPDGSSDYRSKSFSNLIVPPTDAAATAKIEWASWAPSGNIDARGHNLTIGRGVTTTGTARELYGTNQAAGASNIIDQVLKVESGTYSYFRHFTSSGTNRIRKQIVVFGCDYDRAKGDNDKLLITGQLIGATGGGAGNASGTHDANLFTNKSYMKSGTFMTGVTIAGAEWDHSYYIGINGASGATGKRLFEMEGGYLANNIAGGMDISINGTKNSDQYINVFIRIRGGHVLGSIYGGARFAESQGSRQIVLTGGEVNGWIAGGANGNETTQGGTEGASYIYVGGNAKVDSKGDGTSIGSSIGGCVYGAGCGYGPNSTSGEMGLGTNVVVADNAYVERGVYGGGAFGYCATDQTANIYITGGHVEGKSGNYKDRAGTTTNGIIGGVFGGSRMRYGGWANIYMTGGQVDTGVYGGSNYTGTLEHDVKMVITGGQVGKDASHTGNIHGGGYGQPTVVNGDVDIKLGADGAPLGAAGVLVYGDVYGGSALGTVNKNTSNHTNVTLNAGTVNGNIFGGGLGNSTTAADVNGNVAVTVNGGSLNIGGVFGCNNQNGTPKGTVTVTVNHTNPSEYDASGNVSKYAINAVYGGGNQIAYSGKPVVHIVNCDCSIKEVYGGGNAADVGNDATTTNPHKDATDVTIDGGEIDYAFGGGNGSGTGNPGANVKGNANLKIGGGTINNIFGGSNTLGDVYGNANVTLEDINPDCPITVDEVYGGANRAPMAGKPVLTINCIKNKLSNVYGGSKAVDVNSDIVLNINSGQYGKVFGGNNESGAVKGSITVNIDETGCHPIIIDELYAGGNMAAYTTPAGKSEPTVNVISCTHIGQVFGGGYGKSAVITGDPIVNINQIPGKYDPEDKDASDGYSDNTNGKLGTIGTVFGGGNAANVVGNTHVNIGTLENNAHLTTPTNTTKVGANITGNVYGGGNAADVTGRTNVTVGRQKN